MIEEIGRILRTEGGLADPHSFRDGTMIGDPLILAVSGGPDSLCLLDVVWKLGYYVIVAHLDHQLRPESVEDASSVAQMAQERGLKFCLGHEDISGFAKEHHYSIEEAARILRYRFLFHQAHLYQAQAVLTGHTADDQVETVMMHFLRGSGLDGLRGMEIRNLPNPWSIEIPLIRPFLGIWRQDILDYLQANRLQPVYDPTNRDTRYYRNQLRLELLPYIESYNPGFRKRVWQMANIIREDRGILDGTISNAWKECLAEENLDWIAFDLSALRAQSFAVRRHLLRRALWQLRPDLRDVDYPSLQTACAFIDQPSRSGQSDWIGGLRLRISLSRIWVAGWNTLLPDEQILELPQLTRNQTFTLNVPGRLSLTNGWQLDAEIAPNIQTAMLQAEQNQEPFFAWLDASEIKSGLKVRPRLPGDRMKPLGMSGASIKISDMMINQKLPSLVRSAWPIVISGDQIVWVPGLRIAEQFRLKPASESAIQLKLQRIHLD